MKGRGGWLSVLLGFRRFVSQHALGAWLTETGQLEGAPVMHLESCWKCQTSAVQSLFTAHARIPHQARLEVLKWDMGNQMPFISGCGLAGGEPGARPDGSFKQNSVTGWLLSLLRSPCLPPVGSMGCGIFVSGSPAPGSTAGT